MAIQAKKLNVNNKMNTKILEDNYIYISHLGEGNQFWKLPTWPDEISDTMQSNFAQTNALGRTAPVFTFNNAGPRTVQISIPLHRDIMDDINTGLGAGLSDEELAAARANGDARALEGEDYVDKLINALQAIALPKYNVENKAVEPPLVALRLGKEIFIKGVLASAIGLTFSKPILSNGKYAKVDLSLTIAEVDPYDATTVFENGGFRGVVATLQKGMNIPEDE